jgi:1,4-dihydroxy-6-naphthoate synthase
MLFSAIENAVLNGEAELGVIIHENRFTYQQKGLHKIVDLGEYWEEKMRVPIPLGGIAIKRRFESSISQRISTLIKKSIEYSYTNYPFISNYIKHHSQEMSEDVMRQHIDLYVNNFSLDLGADGKKAIEALNDVYNNMHPENSIINHSVFI